MKILMLICIAVFLVGCGPSAADIQKQILQEHQKEVAEHKAKTKPLTGYNGLQWGSSLSDVQKLYSGLEIRPDYTVDADFFGKKVIVYHAVYSNPKEILARLFFFWNAELIKVSVVYHPTETTFNKTVANFTDKYKSYTNRKMITSDPNKVNHYVFYWDINDTVVTFTHFTSVETGDLVFFASYLSQNYKHKQEF